MRRLAFIQETSVPPLRGVLAGVTLVLLTGFGAARADDVQQHTYHVGSGQKISVGAYGRTDRRCAPNGQPLITVSGGPAHGQITMAGGTHIVKHSLGSAQCDGREIADTHVFYTAATGFQGSDSFHLTVRFRDAIIQNDVTVVVQ